MDVTPTKRPKRNVNGVLLLDKPEGISSNAALQIAKRLYQAVKAGHTGNLDPIATGLLPICFGEATKFAQYPTEADKVYEAVVKLGETTTTADREGEVITRKPVSVNREQIEQVLSQFKGEIQQIPPMYSALKHQGQPLYRYARKGVEIERQPRSVRIYGIDLLDCQSEQLILRVSCSKGTYIRVLAEDIGAALGCGAHLTALRRTCVGVFDLVEASTLETLENLSLSELDALLLPPDHLIDFLPPIALSADAAHYLCLGQAVWLPKLKVGDRFRLYDHNQSFIGIGEVSEQGSLAPVRLMAERANPGCAAERSS